MAAATSGSEEACTLAFGGGELSVRGSCSQAFEDYLRELGAQRRGGAWRLPALHYAPLVRWLREHALSYTDEARKYGLLRMTQVDKPTPRPYQLGALAAWERAQRRGVVVLPTGAGKSFVAHLAIEACARPALVVVPTLQLVAQWRSGLASAFRCPVGQLGGGKREVEALTVATYDSASAMCAEIGDRFGLVVFDECHHLPATMYRRTALDMLAPFRLGLSATPSDEVEVLSLVELLVGPVVHQESIADLRGEYLADYEVHQVLVELAPDERVAYTEARAEYLGFLRRTGIKPQSGAAWRRFIQEASRSAAGRSALRAYRLQRQVAFEARAKHEALSALLFAHRKERSIIFTSDNRTAYAIARRLLLPVITHHTPVAERHAVLDAFRQDKLHALVTSKVLNEGVDVPAASVAIIMSGSGSVREHVQRLGRVLRRHGDKRARLYELVSDATSELATSERRRAHRAYQ